MFWYHKSESCEPYVAVYTELSYMPFYESGPQDDTEILFLNEHVVTPRITKDTKVTIKLWDKDPYKKDDLILKQTRTAGEWLAESAQFVIFLFL